MILFLLVLLHDSRDKTPIKKVQYFNNKTVKTVQSAVLQLINKKMKSVKSIEQKASNKKIKFSVLYAPFSILLIILFLCYGCQKESKGDDDDDKDEITADSFNGNINAKVENGSSYNSTVSKVWALFNAEVNNEGELRGRMITEGNYANGKFTIDLPTISDQFLMNIQTYFTSSLGINTNLEFSKPETRILDVDFFGISSNDKYIDHFIFTNSTSKKTICLFVFVDSNVNIEGGSNVNVKLRKGWNRMYWTPAQNKVTSIVPKNMKWYLNNDLN